jgi:hypothetical protein
MSETSQEDNDWAGRATATVVGYVDTVRAASTGKALVASRLAVYGFAIALIALIIGILFLVVLVRFVGTIYAKILPFVEEGEIWPSYLTFGAVFLLGGWVLWRKKEA